MKKSSFFSRKRAGVGLDLGSEWLKLVKVSMGKNGCVLESLSRTPWQSGELDNNVATGKKISSLWGQLALKEKTVVSSMADLADGILGTWFCAQWPRSGIVWLLFAEFRRSGRRLLRRPAGCAHFCRSHCTPRSLRRK